MRYTTTDGPKKPLNAIQEGSLGGKMGIAGGVPFFLISLRSRVVPVYVLSMAWADFPKILILF